jgi:hypothetical protein
MFSHLIAKAGPPFTPPTSISGVRRATPAIRVAAARISASVTSEIEGGCERWMLVVDVEADLSASAKATGEGYGGPAEALRAKAGRSA